MRLVPRIALALSLITPCVSAFAEDAPAPQPSAPAATDTAPSAPPTPVAEPVPSAPAPKSTQTVEGGPGKGITLRAPDDSFSLKLQTRIVPRFDFRLPAADPEADQTAGERLEGASTRATLNTARLWMSGYIWRKEIQYMTQLAYSARDYRDGTVSPVYDAYLDAPIAGGARVRVGQYFVRFDRLRTVREFSLQMTDRPAPIADLTLDRDVGVTFYNDHLFGKESPLAAHLGIFGGRGIGQTALAAPPGGLFVGRLELRPLGAIDDDSEGDLTNRTKPGLALGVGAAYNLNATRLLGTTGAAFTTGTVDYTHLAADLTFKWHGVALQAEYVRRDASEDQILSPGAEEGTEAAWTRSGSGYVAQLSYHAPVGVEVVGRYSRRYATETTDPAFIEDVAKRTHEVAGGLNYYFNDHRFKLQSTLIRRYSDEKEPDGITWATQLDASF